MSESGQSRSEIELDLGRYELRRSGRRIRLEKKPMELLIFLVGRRDQMVSREDIVKKLWRSDRFIDTDRNLNNIVRKVRTALGDDPARPRFLETVVGKGYRFVGPLRLIEAKFPSHDSVPGASYARPRMDDSGGTDRPSLAVLPLVLAGKMVDDQGLCLGFADAVTSALANLQGIDVLPTSAVLNIPPTVAPIEVASRLAVRFVVHGAIQLSKGEWRLSLEMFDSYQRRSCFTRTCDLSLDRLSMLEREIAVQIARVLKRPLAGRPSHQGPRHSRDAVAYAEFMNGYRLSVSGDPALIEKASHHLTAAVTRDANFALAHATLSYVCAVRHFEHDPISLWLEKAEFHCRRALEINPDMPEGLLARAFLLWGPSKNFQHIEAINDLKRAITLQKNMPHAYNRLGTILAHIGLLDQARDMYERGRPFQPGKAVSPSITQVYIWNQEYELARQEIEKWRADSPSNKYPIYFAAQLAMMEGKWKEAQNLMDEALQMVPEEPLLISLRGLLYASTGNAEAAQDCIMRACSSPKSFGHAHHSYYQIACILSLIGRRETGFAWLERSVNTGFACWPFFLKDPSLESMRALPEFEILVSSLQTKYPDYLGLL